MLNGEKCVAGSERGPTYLSSGNKDIDLAYYTWKDKCFGKGCPQKN
jgi:hypothetical protein